MNSCKSYSKSKYRKRSTHFKKVNKEKQIYDRLKAKRKKPDAV